MTPHPDRSRRRAPDGVALRVERLVKRYGDKLVLDDVSLQVRKGEVTCLVGVNGSGKSTIVECVEGIRRPDSGTVEIYGRRCAFGQKRPRELGVQLQEESLPARIRVGEAMDFFRRLYGSSPPRRDVASLLGLDAVWKKRFAELSGGEKRRVVVGLATVTDPGLVILDEPTSGLDPGGQESVLRLIEELRADGVAVLLTIHDMAQAGEIADRVVLLHRGRVRAQGTPRELVDALGVVNCLAAPVELELAPDVVGALAVVRAVVHSGRQYLYGGENMFEGLTGADALGLLAGRGSAGLAAARVEVRPVGLLDVFLAVVGEPRTAWSLPTSTVPS